MEREVRYCTTEDGVRIAYCIEGEGPPLFAYQNFVESFSLDHMLPEQEVFWAKMARHYTVIRFDVRGTGLSQRGCQHYGLEEFTTDLGAVVTATKFERFALWASISSGSFAIKYAADHPLLLTHLVLFCPLLTPSAAMPPDTLRAYAALWRSNPEVAAQAMADQDMRLRQTKIGEQFSRMFRESVTSEDMACILTLAAEPEWDGAPYLPRVKTPTLVMHRRNASISPLEQGQRIAAGIPDSRFVPMDGDTAFYAIENTDAVIDCVLKFTQAGSEKKSVEPASAFRTVLFTDLVGHTEMMSRLGDERGRDVLREHERITREVLKANGGTEVKTMGDGFMASFGSVTKAVECAIALQRAFADREGEPLSVRVGLNAGEPIEEDGDLFGATVILASRIAAKAEGGEILVADTVRGLCSGKGFLFADRGEFVAKGIEEPVRVYEVRPPHRRPRLREVPPPLQGAGRCPPRAR